MKLRSLIVSTMLVLTGAIGASAIYPYWHWAGFMLLKCESGEVAIKTRFKATTSGVETWYRTYRQHIEAFVSQSTYYATLPTWGWGLVTAEKLATVVYYDVALGLQDVYNYDTHLALIEALNDDKSGDSWIEYYSSGGTGGYWDPYNDWKWRSAYMEDRYATNGDHRLVHANCWGTADYLAKDFEWRDSYLLYKPYNWYATFPYIYLSGIQHWDVYCIDDDLHPAVNGRALLKGHGFGDRTPKATPMGMLNSFDVVRLAKNPGSLYPVYELVIDTVIVGENLHCTAFLCTDEQNQVWVYEKHNYGNTLGNPYGINIQGNCQHMSNPDIEFHSVDCYNSSYCSFFKKYGYNKENLADSYDMDWANVEP